MKNSFFSRFTPKEPKFFPLLKQLSEVLCEASVVLIESLQHDSPTERSDYYKKIKDLEREGDRLTHLIFDELGTTFITPFDREQLCQTNLYLQSPSYFREWQRVEPFDSGGSDLYMQSHGRTRNIP